MIFDWNKATKEIVEKKSYFYRDRFEKKTEYRQQIYTCSNLIMQSKTKEEIFEIWRNIPNEFLKIENDKFSIAAYFNKLYGQAQQNLEVFGKYQNVKDIEIYESEINKINTLSGGIEFRKYILVILAIIKYYTNVFGHCELSTSLRSYAFEVATGKRYGDYSKSLSKKNNDNGGLFQTQMFYPKGKGPTCVSTLSFITNSGDVAIRISTPDNISTFFNRIHHPTAICRQCSNTYEIDPKSKTDLCPHCYAEYRKKRKAEYDNKNRKKILDKTESGGIIIADKEVSE